MLRLVELHVRKFRDLVDGGPLRFGPGPVFLLGPNGSGKTTLLELIAVLLTDDLGPLFKEEDAVDLSWALEAEGEGETPTTRLELSLSIDAVSRSTSTDARTAKRERRGWAIHGKLPARSQDEQTLEFRESPGGSVSYNFGAQTISIEGLDPESIVEQEGYLEIVRTHMDVVAAEHDLDSEGLDRFLEIIGRYIYRRLTRFDEALTLYDKILGVHDEPVELLEQPFMAVVPQDLPDWVRAPTDGMNIDTNHPDLTLLTRLLGAERVEFRLRLVSDDGRGRRRWRGFDIYVHWGGGAMHHHSELSFGQKRLIALIWQIGVGVNLPLLTDELTNGLHAGWVQAIIDHLGPRQGFHAVQNPLLLDRYGPGESAADVAGRFVICTVETAERGRQWRWRSPTPEECERLWERFITHYQPLSELLLSESLW